MKNIFLYILLTGFAPLMALAQLGKPYEMIVNGVKVVVQPSGNEIVEILTVIKGGVQNYPANKAGIEALAMRALTECGTLKDDKNSFKNKLDLVSAQVGGGTNMDFASFRMNCIKMDFDKVWPLYTDAMIVPKFDAKEFERIKDEAITSLKAEESNPDNSIDKMARQVAFNGRNYSKDPDGTIETISKLTPSETRNYYKSIFTRSRMLIVVVGELDKQKIEASVKSFLAKVPQGAPFVAKKETYKPAVTSIKPQDKELATNYVQGIMSAPLTGTADYNAFVLAMRIFYDRHFLEVRTNNGLSYAPQIWFSQGLTPYANIYVTTTDPNKYIAVARTLIDKIKKDGFTADELKNMKASYATRIYSQQETANAQAAALAANEVLHNNWRRANTIKDDMKKVTVADLNRVFKTYVNNITWVYQGNTKQVNPTLYTQKTTPPIPKDTKAF
jgi:predicted Zn-dependent peptidase